jgi:hypothetical protein
LKEGEIAAKDVEKFILQRVDYPWNHMVNNGYRLPIVRLSNGYELRTRGEIVAYKKFGGTYSLAAHCIQIMTVQDLLRQDSAACQR